MQGKKSILLTTITLAVLGLTACSGSNPTQQSRVQEVQQIPTSDFFNESSISSLKLSSDGNWLAWLQNVDGIKNIYLMPATGKIEDAYPLTQLAEPVDSFRWAKKGTDIFFSQDLGGNENQQIYWLKTSGTTSLTVDSSKRLTAKDGSDYRFVGQSKNNPNMLSYLANHDDKARVDMYQLDLTTGEQKRILENNMGFRSIEIDDDGKARVAVTMHGDSSQELFALKNGQWQGLFRAQPGEEIDLTSYNQKQNLAFITTSMGELDKLSLMSVDLQTGEYKLLHEDPQNLSDVYASEFDKQGKLLMVSYYYGHKQNYFLDKDFGKHWQKIRAHFTHKVEIELLDRNEDKGKWLVSVASDKDAGSYYSYQESTGKLKLVLKKDTVLDADLLAEKKSITYKARDGETIQAYLTLPVGQSNKLPTIILPHGGPWARDHWTLDSGYFNRVTQLLANRGYAVLQPNFRASTGFGERFYNLGNQNWGTGTMQHDLTDGAQYLIDQGIADPKRLGIFGASYGGYAALAGITYTPDLYQAAISYVGPSSLVTLMNSFPPHYRPYLGNWFTAVGDPLIDADVAKMQLRSPINYVDKIKTPLLLVQGANDPRVTQQESDNIARQMYKTGLPVDYILAKDEGHGFHKRDNQLALMMKMEQFLAKHLGGKTNPAPSHETSQHLKTLQVDIGTL